MKKNKIPFELIFSRVWSWILSKFDKLPAWIIESEIINGKEYHAYYFRSFFGELHHDVFLYENGFNVCIMEANSTIPIGILVADYYKTQTDYRLISNFQMAKRFYQHYSLGEFYAAHECEYYFAQSRLIERDIHPDYWDLNVHDDLLFDENEKLIGPKTKD